MQVTKLARARRIRRLSRRLSGQGGFALPTTLLMLLAAFAIVSVGVAATVDVQRGTVRDQKTKSAVQLAETGVSQAMLHFNRIRPSATPSRNGSHTVIACRTWKAVNPYASP